MPEEGGNWAFVLAPRLEGWRIKFLPDGARLTTGGGLVHSLEEAHALIQSLIPLLKEDELTKQLLRLMHVPDVRREEPAGDGHGASGAEPDRDLLQVVWEASADAIALSDPEGIVLHANPAYCRLYGYPPEQVIGHSYAIIFPEEAREWAVAAYQRTFHDPAIAPDVVSVVRRADGSERIVEVRYNFVVRDGKRVAMVSTIRDLTEQKRLNQDLRKKS